MFLSDDITVEMGRKCFCPAGAPLWVLVLALFSERSLYMNNYFLYVYFFLGRTAVSLHSGDGR